mmetsp:Transcript_11475/g.36480  ORF Transcript_11475/g.36480 Transcript_11475/m.36480 type:complete len:204 (-) Transcript_11475:694-1305(-)
MESHRRCCLFASDRSPKIVDYSRPVFHGRFLLLPWHVVGADAAGRSDATPHHLRHRLLLRHFSKCNTGHCRRRLGARTPSTCAAQVRGERADDWPQLRLLCRLHGLPRPQLGRVLHALLRHHRRTLHPPPILCPVVLRLPGHQRLPHFLQEGSRRAHRRQRRPRDVRSHVVRRPPTTVPRLRCLPAHLPPLLRLWRPRHDQGH